MLAARMERSIPDSCDYEGGDHGIADVNARGRFEPTPCTGLEEIFSKELEEAGFRLWQCCMANFDKMLEVDALRH